ncbi:EF-hand calcium-binding domain-containing protein 4B isoform X1 [Hydra vulgaris]|uniref:EF-hand calcium-binding domain-containing protein 4B isoform X1 n=1 Tax=Hydra vulgaris TaxID=6087 RepID=UPI0002B4BC8A|nr:EF-hand calcium-binding domain-containing protein 4B [Hydra vulgaris]XP_047128785.1 EF-hand calcium-binding domain-containing protein 4B [Hydra vulgaris]
MFRSVESDMSAYIHQRLNVPCKPQRAILIMRDTSPLVNKKDLTHFDFQSTNGWKENTLNAEESSEDSEPNKDIISMKGRKSSVMSLSNVKRKISSTFQRKNSITHMSTETQPHISQRKNSIIKDDVSEILNKRQNKTNTTRASVSSYPARKESIIGREANALNTALDKLSSAPLEKELYNEYHLDKCKEHEYNDSNKINYYIEKNRNESSFGCRSILQSINSIAEPLKNFCLFLLGNKSTGKTALTVRYLTGRYIHEYKSVPEEKYTRTLTIEDELADVNIYVKDIEQLKKEIELFENSGIMVLYSVVDRYSFVTAKVLLKHLTENSIANKHPIMLIGTKKDLAKYRKVTREEGFDLANKNNCSFFEVSAAADKKVKDCFQSAFRQIQVRKLLSTTNSENSTIFNPSKISHGGFSRHGSV